MWYLCPLGKCFFLNRFSQRCEQTVNLQQYYINQQFPIQMPTTISRMKSVFFVSDLTFFEVQKEKFHKQSVSWRMICLQKNNIPQQGEPVENDIDFSLDLDFEPPAAVHAYHKLNILFIRPSNFQIDKEHIMLGTDIDSDTKTFHGRTKNVNHCIDI